MTKEKLYVIPVDFMDKLLKNVTPDEIDALHQFLVMYHKLEASLIDVKDIKEDDHPYVIGAMGKFGSVIIYGAVHLRQLFNRVYSMLPIPEDATEADIARLRQYSRSKPLNGEIV